MPKEQSREPPKQGGSNTTLIVLIVIVVILIIIGIAGCGCYYMYKKARESTIMPTIQPTATEDQTPVATTSPTPTSTSTTTSNAQDSPSTVVENYMSYTLGTIPGAYVDYDAAKNYTSNEIAQQLDDSSFVPLSYCIQQGPDEVSISSENIDGLEATVTVSAKWGEWQTPWEFLLVNGSDGWKIKSITCLDTGKTTQ